MSRSDRSVGMMVGFAVGDAFGAPVAGLRASDARVRCGSIRNFTSNPAHPLLGHLQPGQYTENTILMVGSARDTLAAGGFNRERRATSLYDWASGLRNQPFGGRWAGPTTKSGALSLGADSQSTGSSTSIGACYRVPPLAAWYRSEERLKEAVCDEVALTHKSLDSVSASLTVALILSRCLNGAALSDAIPEALNSTEVHLGPNTVTAKCWQALEWDETVDAAREMFGTGAKADNTLPLALWIVSHFSGVFSSAIEAAANSFRADGIEAPHPCCSLKEELEAVNGGNTDGLAAIVGCIIGSHLGITGIEERWHAVEDVESLIAIGKELAMEPDR